MSEENVRDLLVKFSAEHGHEPEAFCEKCYDSMAVEAYVPYGGATTFAEMFKHREAMKTEAAYSMATYDYQDLARNIQNDPDMSASEKADALVRLSAEFTEVIKNAPALYGTKEAEEEEVAEDDKVGRRMGKSQVSVLKSAVHALRGLVHWSTYADNKNMMTDDEEDEKDEDEEDEDEEYSKAVKSLMVNPSGFKVVESAKGPRWITFSSNSFIDYEKEIFRLDALQEAVDYADRENDRGPLRIFHVKGADIGDADFQAVIGRFLVESGTFRDDDKGQAGLKYFREHKDVPFQVSIGYQYRAGDEEDGIYDWLRIKERSITPAGRAANPFTFFAAGDMKEEDMAMDEEKAAMMDDIFGKDLAAAIMKEAEGQTKSLEEAGISFKQNEAKATPSDPKVVELLTALKEQGDAINQSLAHTAAALLKIGEAIASVQVAAEAKAEEEKSGDTPRGASTFNRASSQGEKLDPEKIKELIGDDGQKAVSPVSAYITDLLGAGAR